MPFVIRRNCNSQFLICGVEIWEFYWTDDPKQATQFSIKEEAANYCQDMGILWRAKVVDIISIPELREQKSSLSDAFASTLTLEQLKEGDKFQYATGGNLTFMKIVQPPKGDELEHVIAETDGRYYLHPCSDASWVVIIENSGKHHPNCAVGRVIALNNGVLVKRLA